MSKPFDATTKQLLESHPRDWLRFLLGRELGEVRVLNVDLSTITTEADSVLRVEGPEPWLVHVEFQASHDATLPLRLQRYNILVQYRHGLPVRSIALLLRREADDPAMTGLLQHRLPDGFLCHEFRYNVVRIWERPVEEILAAGIATLPLAPLTNVSRKEVPRVIRRMEERLDREVTKPEAAMLWTATYLMMGLVYPQDFIKALFQGIRAMKESVTYQAILEEGKAEGWAQGLAEGLAEGRVAEARQLLLRLGRKRFGPPSPATEATIQAVTDLAKIEELTERLLDASSWDQWLAGV